MDQRCRWVLEVGRVKESVGDAVADAEVKADVENEEGGGKEEDEDVDEVEVKEADLTDLTAENDVIDDPVGNEIDLPDDNEEVVVDAEDVDKLGGARGVSGAPVSVD